MSNSYGYSVILKKNAPIIVKLLWIILLCLLLSCFAFYLIEGYYKYKIHPDVTISTEYIRSNDIPFPAVTICSPLIIKSEFVNKSKFFLDRKHFNNKKGISDNDRTYLTAAAHVCPDSAMNILNPDYYFNKFDQRTVHILNESSPTLEDTFNTCGFELIEYCGYMFSRVLTDDGYCFSFNMEGFHTLFNKNISSAFESYKRSEIIKIWSIDSSKRKEYFDDINNPEPSMWSLQDGYLTNNSLTHPLRAKKSLMSLITSIIDTDIPNFCELRHQGYKVIFHLPNEIPTPFHTETYFDLKNLKTMSIGAEVIRFDDSLRRLSTEQRGCYFDGERQLRFFKSYTQKLCEYECLVNYTLEVCECVKFSMPRNESTRVCEGLEIQCYTLVMKYWPEPDPIYNKLNNKEIPKFPCNCFQSCTQIKYTIQNERIFQITKENSPALYFLANAMSTNYGKNETFSFLDITFQQTEILQTTHFIAYKIQNFISDIGGLLGLFLGVSIISILELFAYVIHSIKIMFYKLPGKILNAKKTIDRQNDNIIQVAPAAVRTLNHVERKIFGETVLPR